MKMSKVFRASLIVAVFFGLEKVLGLARRLIVNRQFGRSIELDAFEAANTLPELLFAIIAGGALAIALIPVLSEYHERGGRPALWDLFARVANLVFLVTAGLSVLVALFANQLVLVLAPGFDASQQALVAELMRLNLFSTLLFSMAGLVIAGLQANQHFLLPAMAPSMYDIGALFGILVLSPDTPYQLGPLTLPAYGMGIQGVVYGTVLGSLLFLLVQVPGLWLYQFRWKPVIDLRNPGVRQVVRVLVPRALNVAFIQVIFIIQERFASFLITGSVNALALGWLFMQVPETIIGTAIGVALLPTLSEQVARQEREAFGRSLNHALRVILALSIPAAVLIGMALRPVVGLLNFDEIGTNLVTWTARAFLIGLVGHSLLEVAVRGFYAQQDARTPLYAAILTALAFSIIGFILYQPLGAPGIALANTLAFTGEAVLLLYLLNRKVPGLLLVGGTLLRGILAGVLGGLVVFGGMAVMGESLIAAILSLIVGVAFALPFVLPEIKLLVRL
jgi:putative peptidoglycan lipid II flippase